MKNPTYRLYFFKTKMSLVLISSSFFIVILLILYNNRIHQNVDELQKRVSSLDILAVRSHQIAALIKENEKEYSAFEVCNFETPLTTQALENYRSYVTKIGPSTPVQGKSSAHTVVSQEVIFLVPCLQDREVFELLEKLTKEGPGIFQIHEVTIHRMSSLSEDMLEKIAAGKPQVLFEGKIRATWVHQ